MVQCYQSMFIEIIKENNLSIYTILINSYGYVQFEKKEDADKLIERIHKHPITHKGKLLKLE